MKKIIILIGILGLSGCATQTFTVNGGKSSMQKANESQVFFLSGIGQEKSINAAKICRSASKVVKVEVKQEFIDVVFSSITFGIYTPRHAKVYCKK